MTADVESHGVAMYRISFEEAPSNNNSQGPCQDPSNNNDEKYVMTWYDVILGALLSVLYD